MELEVGGDQVGAAEDGRFVGRRADRPPRDFHRRDKLERLDAADAPQPAEVGLVPGNSAGERPGLRNEPGGNGEHVLALRAASDDHRQELRVAQRGRA